jgi:hypothetical protein
MGVIAPAEVLPPKVKGLFSLSSEIQILGLVIHRVRVTKVGFLRMIVGPFMDIQSSLGGHLCWKARTHTFHSSTQFTIEVPSYEL